MRLLVYDDDAAIGRMIVRVATSSGLDAAAVTEAAAFANIIRTNPPQIIALDLQLGETDGIEQLRVLANQHYSGALILMSGFDVRVLATARELAAGLGLNVECVLEKPIELGALEQTFERLLSAGQSPSPERVRDAIANDEMSLDFQPIVTRKPKKLVKLEALIRWDHPAIGRIPPGIFLPVAERDPATIDALTGWVVNAAVEAYQVLAELGVREPLSINMSALNLHDLEWPDRIQKHLQKGGMPASHLCLEITESSAFEDPTRTMEVLSRLRLKGMQLAIDDFGTGYSSLKVLRQMPFSELKIDQSFVKDVTTSRDSRAIVKSIVGLAANMEMSCIAEGVETEAIADLLEELGVRMLQGYLIAQPMPVESVPAWLAIWTQTATVKPSQQATATTEPPPSREPDQSAPPKSGASRPSPVPPKSDTTQLSPRQIEVLQLAAEGCSVKHIARRLNLAIGTVKIHLALAYSTLGVHNRIDAIRRAGPAVLSRMTDPDATG